MLEFLIKNEDAALFDELAFKKDDDSKNEQLRILGLLSLCQTINH